MTLRKFKIQLFLLSGLIVFACGVESPQNPAIVQNAINESFGGNINLEALENYSEQEIPAYITKDNSSSNPITDAEATLGRVLFYDKNLSINNTVSCSSCHQQEFAFSDDAVSSNGVNGTTGRHSMRLINARFSRETQFFWDERANSLEEQTTMPIQDHDEMGFSGKNGDPDFEALLIKLESIDYYSELFNFVYNDNEITEARIQGALSSFVRSIQSFDSRYDEGRAMAGNDQMPFPNFTDEENLGKMLFLAPSNFDNTGNRVNGGAGCAGCHQAPEFDIDPNTRNNGIIGSISGETSDLTVTRSPSLRDVLKSNGASNGPFMHTGETESILAIINHYDQITLDGNNNLDPRLMPQGNPQNLNLNQIEKEALIAFLKTLAGTNVYTDERWSNPFIE